jgi:dsDNA-specific endonuclease/ATPase MutS2
MKLIDDQVEKTGILISGLRNNKEVVKDWGINETLIDELETGKAELIKDNQELERLRAEVKEKSGAAKKKMANLQEKFMEVKIKVKRNTDFTTWSKFGVMDKR